MGLLGAVITQVHVLSNPKIQKCAVLYVHSIILLVCCLYKLQGKSLHVGAVSLYNMFLYGHHIHILRLHWMAWHSLGKIIP